MGDASESDKYARTRCFDVHNAHFNQLRDVRLCSTNSARNTSVPYAHLTLRDANQLPVGDLEQLGEAVEIKASKSKSETSSNKKLWILEEKSALLGILNLAAWVKQNMPDTSYRHALKTLDHTGRFQVRLIFRCDCEKCECARDVLSVCARVRVRGADANVRRSVDYCVDAN
jgi:hypothetical protein